MRIIYKNGDNSVSVLIPTEEALSFATIEQIADKDVPQDLPYWIVSSDDVPTDRSQREAWEIDEDVMGDPHGFGGESNEFTEEQLQAAYKAGVI